MLLIIISIALLQFMQCLQTCYTQPNLIWPSWSMPVILMSFYQMPHLLYQSYSIKASPGAAIFGQNMLFEIPFIADWKKIGEHWQWLTDLNTAHENESRIDYNYKVGQKILVWNKGILCKAESRWQKDPWTITTVNMNGTIIIQCRNKEERLNIRRVKPFEE
jgi:hypothetical protein